MGLSIEFEINNNTVQDTAFMEWHIGGTPIKYNMVNNVIQCCVDGHELEFIKNNFTNIVIPKHQKVVRFFGETAKMIVGNL